MHNHPPKSILNKYSSIQAVTNKCLLALHGIQSIPYESLRHTANDILIFDRFLLLHREFHKSNLVPISVAKKERVMPWQVLHLAKSINSMRPSR